MFFMLSGWQCNIFLKRVGCLGKCHFEGWHFISLTRSHWGHQTIYCVLGGFVSSYLKNTWIILEKMSPWRQHMSLKYSVSKLPFPSALTNPYFVMVHGFRTCCFQSLWLQFIVSFSIWQTPLSKGLQVLFHDC